MPFVKLFFPYPQILSVRQFELPRRKKGIIGLLHLLKGVFFYFENLLEKVVFIFDLEID